MSNFSEQVKAVIEQLSYNQLFVANELHKKFLIEVPEKTFYKILERLVRQGQLVHLTKGLYYRPELGEDGIVPISKEDIISHYVEDKRGVVIGSRLYHSKGICDKSVQEVEIISNNLQEERKHIGDIEVQKTAMLLDDSTIPVIETLEILQNYDKVDNINGNRFLAYMRGFAEQYSDEATQYVIEHRKYKKSTIAFMDRVLDWYGVENSLDKHLSALSEYKIPTIEELRPGIPAEMQSRLQAYVLELKKLYKNELNKVILYGSYARGDYNKDSDVDIMILLHMPDIRIKEYRHQLSDLTYDFNMNYNLDIKPIAKNEAEFEKWVDAYPFYANVRKEGVELYGAA